MPRNIEKKYTFVKCIRWKWIWEFLDFKKYILIQSELYFFESEWAGVSVYFAPPHRFSPGGGKYTSIFCLPGKLYEKIC